MVNGAVTDRVLATLVRVEKAGNKLPHPFWLFGVLGVVLALASWALSAAGASALSPATGEKSRS